VTTPGYRELMQLLHRAALLSDRVGDRLFLRSVGVGRAVFLVLRTIDDARGSAVSQQSIADRLGLTRAAMSRHASTARQGGWLVSTESTVSRRENALTLTASGKDLVRRGRAVQSGYEQLTSDRLTDEQLAATITTLTVMCEILEEAEKKQ
jgi:DNA-binding MarR family transcriptional regulator